MRVRVNPPPVEVHTYDILDLTEEEITGLLGMLGKFGEGDMAPKHTITCPNCHKRDINQYATNCPRCGFYLLKRKDLF